MKTICHKDVTIKDILFFDISFMESNGKQAPMSYLCTGKACRDGIVKKFSVYFDDVSTFDDKDYRNDLYIGVNLSMNNGVH